MSSRYKVLLTDRIDKAGIEILEAVAEVKTASGSSEDVLVREIEDVDAVIVRVPAVITKHIMENARRLKIIARFGVGYDNIDVGAATIRGIPVTFTPGANTLAVAEYGVALMFCLAKQIMSSDKALRQRRWEMRFEYGGVELAGKTLAILGLGVIGVEVARLARALGMRVIYWDVVRKLDIEKSFQIEFIPFTQSDEDQALRVPERLLSESDFITLHVPLNEKTKGIIGEKEISRLRPSAFLINTARGGIVDEHALYDALRSCRLGGAGLDVFEKEPPYDSPLLTLDNVIVGPHVAALAGDTARRMSVMVAQDTVRVLTGKRPIYLVNPQVYDAIL